jgi:hypothetical protein
MAFEKKAKNFLKIDETVLPEFNVKNAQKN